MQLTDKQLSKLKKLSKFAEDKDLATVEEFDNLEQRVNQIDAKLDENATKLDNAVSTITDELKKKLSEELVYEIDREELKGERGSRFLGYFDDESKLPSVESLCSGDFAIVGVQGTIWYTI